MSPLLQSAWAMPNAHTFRIPPIAELLRLFVAKGEGWADPFAGWNSPAQHQNDLNPLAPTRQHGEATDFLARFPDESLLGIILDPPYSPPQIKECCQGIGLSSYTTNGSFLGRVKNLAAKKVVPGGLAVCFGWNSNGLGKKRAFELIHVLTVRHGGNHNDTIVTVEIKGPYQAADDFTAYNLAEQRSQEQWARGMRTWRRKHQ